MPSLLLHAEINGLLEFPADSLPLTLDRSGMSEGTESQPSIKCDGPEEAE